MVFSKLFLCPPQAARIIDPIDGTRAVIGANPEHGSMTTAGVEPLARPDRSARADFGDFQTPPRLAAEVLARLRADCGRFDRVLEPSCGVGRFLQGVLDGPEPPREVRGVEIQPEHAAAARDAIGPRGRILVADLFRLDLARDLGWEGGGRLLVVGNPPWVTVAALGASGGDAVNPGPTRSNARGARGIDALTGGSNFCLAEAAWIKLIRELAPERPTIALLCKASVARALLRSAHADRLPIVAASFRRIDAGRWFGAAVAAGLFTVEVGPGPAVAAVPVYPSLAAATPEATWGVADGSIVADLAAYERSRFADGATPIAWRQGVKHDAARVMELTPRPDGGWANGLGEPVEVEPDRVYPWFKATDLARGATPTPRRAVLISQRALGEDTRNLALTHPRLWAYLEAHAEHFDRRKSSIYRGRPPFALFGIGPYTFSPFKVAISGLHKSYRFRAIGPIDGRPPLVDDTGYFLPVPSAEAACTLAAALNGPEAADLLRALASVDAKRPITQATLRRLDLRALLDRTDRAALRDRAEAERAGLAAVANLDDASWPLAWQDGWAVPAPAAT